MSGDPDNAARFLVEFEAGESIFESGDAGDEMFIVHRGEVEILRPGSGGADSVAVLGKGDFFGEMSLLEELPRLASARAKTAVTLVRVDNSAFDKLLRGEPEIAIRIMRKLSRRLRESDERLRSVPVPEAAPEPDPPLPRQALVMSHLPSRTRFELGAAETSVGRGDPVTGFYPDVDLTPVDPDRSSSRRHAKFFLRDGAVHLVEEVGTTNGTFVNGVRLQAGQPLRVTAGDEIRFGLVELALADES